MFRSLTPCIIPMAGLLNSKVPAIPATPSKPPTVTGILTICPDNPLVSLPKNKSTLATGIGSILIILKIESVAQLFATTKLTS